MAAARAGAGKLLGRGGCRSRWHPLVERTHDVSITSRFASNYHDFMTRAEAATEIPLRFYSWYHRFVIKLRRACRAPCPTHRMTDNVAGSQSFLGLQESAAISSPRPTR
eukprot:COSAG01_NODE_6830_length_3481_cov_4.968953_3_plen_109_part_00